MNYRKSEIDKLKLDTRWLDQVKSLIIDSDQLAKQWLSERLESEGTVQVVFSESEAFVIPTEQFVDNWPKLLVPARDDAVILHNFNKQVVFYCHENELEIGHRNAQQG